MSPTLSGTLRTPIPELNPYAENYQRLVKGKIKTKWEDRFRALVKGLGAPPWREQYVFHDSRKWRFDFAWPERKIAFEMEGAIWMKGFGGRTGGGHSHPMGIEKDIEKYNAAAIAGWCVIRITDKMLPARTLFFAEAAQLVTAAFKLDPNRLMRVI